MSAYAESSSSSRMNDFFTQKMDWSTIGKTSDLPEATKKHMAKVYVSLVATVISAAAGAALYMSTGIGGLLGQIGMFVALFAFSAMPPVISAARFGMLLAFGALQGMALGPLIEQVAFIDPSIVTSAFLGASLVFGSFSAAAMFAKRRSYLYLGGVLGSALSLLFWGGLINMFFRSALMFNVQLYLGLVVFSGFVLVDSQMIAERHMNGDDDFIGHSVKLFVDFAAIFVRILIILARNSSSKKDRRERR
eukprot:TRINITY_DN200_c0_g3_i2.p1 TRINITY_DN200_c0_g3~~TRINITY_DN200_c0_g3_i2.p1  ORF type:complete len:249 (-),score=119.78 TRINITY_DN200_c0_g3_i2:60-806(-)